jgi:hypothetical protein
MTRNEPILDHEELAATFWRHGLPFSCTSHVIWHQQTGRAGIDLKPSIPAYSLSRAKSTLLAADSAQLRSPSELASSPAAQRGVGADGRSYLILARHSFRRSSSKRT